MRCALLLAGSMGEAVLSGCDPVINVAGANFPAWLVCALGAALIRPGLVAIGVEPYLWPVSAVYVSLAILIAGLVYLVCFGRV
jgi:hypothetical protein